MMLIELQPLLQSRKVAGCCRKSSGTRDQIDNIEKARIIEKPREFQKKTSTSASLTMLKSLCGSQQNVENS